MGCFKLLRTDYYQKLGNKYGKYLRKCFDSLALGKENIWKHNFKVKTCTYNVVGENIFKFGPSNNLMFKKRFGCKM